MLHIVLLHKISQLILVTNYSMTESSPLVKEKANLSEVANEPGVENDPESYRHHFEDFVTLKKK